LRSAIIEPDVTNAFRVIHGASDGWPGWFVEKLGDFLLSQSEAPLTAAQNEELSRLAGIFSARGAYHKTFRAKSAVSTASEVSPQLVLGEAAPERFEILENGVRYEMSFNEGYSVGLFLDQRDNRRRLLTGHIAADFPLFKSEIGNSATGNFEHLRLHLRLFRVRGQGGRADDQPRSLEKIPGMGPAQFRAERPRPGGARFHLRRHVRLAAAAGETGPRVRRRGARSADVFAVEGKRHVPRGKKLRQLVTAALPVLKPGGVSVRLDERGGPAAGEILADIETAVARRKAENPATALRSAAAGFSHQPRRAGVFENGVAAPLSRTCSVAETVKEVKRSSSLWLKTQSSDLHDFAWQNGYDVFSIGFSQVETVRNYIAGQEVHHRKISFQDEFREFLKRYEIEFDERYVWD
jgi:hypothetical protein